MKQIIICDIDGTLANIAHRLHFIAGEKKDWDSFQAEENLYKDSPNRWCVELLRGMNSLYGIRVIFVSGRWERSRAITLKWLENKCGITPPELYMRADGDYRPDFEVKQEILDKHIPKEEVLFAVDDRTQIVEMWRRNEIICLQCQGKDY